jgi:Tol biopolymer transport system component
MEVYELLQDCTVRLEFLSDSSWGTGFFVADKLVLTCAHVVGSSQPGTLGTVFWKGKSYRAEIYKLATSPQVDLALVKIIESLPENNPSVYLDLRISRQVLEARRRDTFHSFGYPENQGEPEAILTQYEWGGKVPNSSIHRETSNVQYSFISFKNAQVIGGQSGSPLLNDRTRKVCGIIKYGLPLDFGGGAIPTSIALSEFSELKKLNEAARNRNKRWGNLLPGAALKKYLLILFCVAVGTLCIHNVLNPDSPKLTLIESLSVQSNIVSVASDPKIPFFAGGSRYAPIQVREWESKNIIKRFSDNSKDIWGLAISHDGKTLASAHRTEKVVKLWDLSTGQLLKTLEGHLDELRSVSFSPDGKYIATGSADKTVKLWSMKDKKLVHTFSEHTDTVTSVMFSHDGTFLAGASDDETIIIWSLRERKVVKTLKGHSGQVLSIAFSPNDEVLVSSSGEDRFTNEHEDSIKIWNLKTGQILHTLTGHVDWVWDVDISPDGTKIASCSYDQEVRLWDITTGNLLGIGEGHSKSVFSVAFSPDGKTLLSGSDDGTLKVWQTPDFRSKKE